jgi:hypothetical protein
MKHTTLALAEPEAVAMGKMTALGMLGLQILVAAGAAVVPPTTATSAALVGRALL